MSEEKIGIEFPYREEVLTLVKKAMDAYLAIMGERSYNTLISKVMHFADTLHLLYALLPPSVREELDSKVGRSVKEYVSYEVTMVRGSGNRLVYRLSVEGKEGIEALNELMSRCRKVLFALIDYLSENEFVIYA